MDLVSLITSTTSKIPPNPNAWDISKAYYDPGSNAGNISMARYMEFYSISQDTFPEDVFFKPDGTKMYIVGDQNNLVFEYTLSTPWLLSSSSYVQSFNVDPQDSSPKGLFFKSDGTKMYIAGDQNNRIYEYTLSTPWNISTASYIQFAGSTEVTPNAVYFSDDGTRMYVVGTSSDTVFQFSLSTPWNLSTVSSSGSFSVAAQEANPSGLSFNGDGTKMYICGTTGDDINQYALSTPWDVSSATYVQNFSVSSQDLTPSGIYFDYNASNFYVVGTGNDRVYAYTIKGFSVAAQDTIPTGLFFKPDGTKMYIAGSQGDDVNEYDLSTAWDITTATYLQNFSVAAQEAIPFDLFFKPDGTKMYILGLSGLDVNEYSLSSAWDVSTASYVQNFSISARDNSPQGLFFKPDGTKMYFLGGQNDSVYEYTLSTPWDISTATYVQAKSVNAQSEPSSLSFKTDGTKMYIVGQSINDKIDQYDLATAWDISTASLIQSFSIVAQGTATTGLFFRPDGTQFFTSENTYDEVFSYSISPI